MFNLSEMLGEDRILLDLNFKDYGACVEHLARHLVGCGLISPNNGDSLVAAFQSRETLGPTNIGRGVVIPHAYLDGLANTLGCFARLAQPFAYGKPDEEPVDLVLLITGPEREQRQHLQTLAHIVRMFHDDRLLAELRAAPSPKAVLEAMRKTEGRHA